MRRSMLAGGLLTTLALVLAGCTGTGNFDVQQTEPFRVQLEGAPQTVVVDEGDDGPQEVVVATCRDPCDDDDRPDQVTVKVQVTSKVADEACIVKIIIKDRTTGEILDEREVDTGRGGDDDHDEDDGGGSTSTVTQTQTQTQTVTQTATRTETQQASNSVVIEDIVVNVKGNNNIVVLTQAIQGSADVDISAARASGNADVDQDDDEDDSTSTTSASMTATST